VHEYQRFWNERLELFERYFKDKNDHFNDKKEEGEEVMKNSKKTIEMRVERSPRL